MRNPTILAIAACLIALGQKPLDAQYDGPFHMGGFGDGYLYVPALGVPVAPDAVIEIADEPRTIDPATLLPQELTRKVTLAFDKTPLREVVDMLKKELGIEVILDDTALYNEDIPTDIPIVARAKDEPAYLLLDRIVGHRFYLGWSFRDGILRITSQYSEERRFDSRAYDLSSLLNDGYEARHLCDLLDFIPNSRWKPTNADGGTRNMVGETLVVWQTHDVRHQVAGLIAALKTPARRILVYEPAQHESLRDLLERPISVNFDETPLNEALAILSEQIGATISIDQEALSDEGTAPDSPVSLLLSEKPLRVVMDWLLERLELACIVEQGQLTVTTATLARELMGLSLFDVRDICRNNKTSRQLLEMIWGNPRCRWAYIHGDGGRMAFARPGILLVQHSAAVRDEIFSLIEELRSLRQQAEPASERPWEHTVDVRFYRMSASVADYMERNLPTQIAPESWRSEARPDAPGTIERIPMSPIPASGPLAPQENAIKENDEKRPDEEKAAERIVKTVVLAIRQTANAHEEIAALRQRAESCFENNFSWGTCGYGPIPLSN
ncbi:MAG: hypothetical protein KF777_08595 [Planctomycetaceae bacterium]|nr:hypothetical protein [Planctomycetaceae bacterium]